MIQHSFSPQGERPGVEWQEGIVRKQSEVIVECLLLLQFFDKRGLVFGSLVEFALEIDEVYESSKREAGGVKFWLKPEEHGLEVVLGEAENVFDDQVAGLWVDVLHAEVEEFAKEFEKRIKFSEDGENAFEELVHISLLLFLQ